MEGYGSSLDHKEAKYASFCMEAPNRWLVHDRRKPNGADEGKKLAALNHRNVQYDTGMQIGMSVRETIELDVTAETSKGERKT